MTGLLAGLQAPPSGRRRAVWFDNLGYCRDKLLAGGPVPWDSPGELVAFFAKAQGMFSSDALLVDLADLYGQLAADGKLREAMLARSRPGYPLRVLLSDETARARAEPALTALAASTVVPVLLTLPSPARWLSTAAELAGRPAGPPDADQADTAAMYVADLLRVFAATGIDGLLLDEGATPAHDLVDPQSYTSVLKVAEHYEWPVFIRTDAAPAWPRGTVPGVAGWVGSAAPPSPAPTWGMVAGEDGWTSAEGDVLLAAVTAKSDPETAMRAVRALP
jgi:hypothetical protein